MSSPCLISTAAGLSLLGLALTLGACATEPGDDVNSSGAGGSSTTTTSPPSLRFSVEDPKATQALFPEEIKEFEVVALPPDVYQVRFSIVPVEQMPPHDASLDRTDADTDENGVAKVTLRAPSIVTVFNLQAAIGSTASTSITIGVQLKGETELQVIPEYDGTRGVGEWVANAYMSTLCSELPAKVPLEKGLPADSMFNASSVFGIPPRITELRVEPFMAVTLRAGHYAFGCTNVNQTLANELNTVRVLVQDRPIQIDAVELDLNFGIGETTDAWTEHLQQAAEGVVESFTEDSGNDLELVLDTMQALLDESSAADFEAKRRANAWELKALASLASADGLLLRDKLATWLETGTHALTLNDAWTARLLPPGDTTSAELEVVSVGGAKAASAGFETEVSATWTADPSDTVALGATLSWAPKALVTELASVEARAEFTDASRLDQALGELLNCRTLAEALASDPETDVFLACDTDCSEALCQSALSELAARLLRDDKQQELQLSATGAAVVDDQSRLVSFEGSWRGTFPDGESSAVGGTVTGARSEEGP